VSAPKSKSIRSRSACTMLPPVDIRYMTGRSGRSGPAETRFLHLNRISRREETVPGRSGTVMTDDRSVRNAPVAHLEACVTSSRARSNSWPTARMAWGVAVVLLATLAA
jgi:hypothetical protein